MQTHCLATAEHQLGSQALVGWGGGAGFLDLIRLMCCGSSCCDPYLVKRIRDNLKFIVLIEFLTMIGEWDGWSGEISVALQS